MPDVPVNVDGGGLDLPFSVRFAETVLRAGLPVEVPLRGEPLRRRLRDVVDDNAAHPGVRIVASWLTSSTVRSQRTRDAYCVDVEQLLEWLVDRGVPLVAMTRADVERWQHDLQHKEGLAGSTRARKLAAVSSLFNYLLDAGLVDTNPTVRVGRDVSSTQRTAPLSVQQAGRLLTVATRLGHLEGAIVGLLLLAGLRVSEVCGARLDAVEEVDGGVRVLQVDKKGGGTVRVPLDGPGRHIGQVVDRHAAARPEHSVWVLCNDEGQPLDRHKVAYRLSKVGAAAGVPKVTPHRLRATFVTVSQQEGVPLADTQVAVGHADPRTTLGYWEQSQAWRRHPAQVVAGALDGQGHQPP